ncbi:MAG: right-handed parallel beta-helix repeat-containing protein [Candidatus Lindowbacteria bacterium]|nr:right-handed parallel beta-helix repeat-containing protein [Candidatus Lindowbacteria bacterium]
MVKSRFIRSSLSIALFAIVTLFALSSPVHAVAPNIWYVNDTSTVGDSFTTAVGNDANSGTSPATPKLTLNSIFPQLTSGDTVYIDKGTFSESVSINTDSISIIGADSGPTGTIIDPGDSTTTTVKGIQASGRVGLLIKNLRIQNTYHGIEWNNVSSSQIEGVTAIANATHGFYIRGTSSLNMINNNTLEKNVITGMYLVNSGNRNTVTRNSAIRNGNVGFDINTDSTSRLRLERVWLVIIYLIIRATEFIFQVQVMVFTNKTKLILTATPRFSSKEWPYPFERSKLMYVL